MTYWNMKKWMLEKKESLKLEKENATFAIALKVKFLLSKKQEVQVFNKNKIWDGHCCLFSNSARTDSYSVCTVLKMHDLCGKSGSKCHKQVTFSPEHFQLESCGFKSKLMKVFEGTEINLEQISQASYQYTSFLFRNGCWS